MIEDPPIRICVNKIEKRITFTIKIGYYLKLSMHETIKLLGSTKRKITRNKNRKMASFRNL